MNGAHTSTPAASEPLLSIVMSGRDDDYMPDFLYRLTTTLNFFAMALVRIGRLHEVEILMTDWGSATPLSETLELSAAAQELCRFIYVPADLIRHIQNGSDEYHPTLAINVGLRRGRGKFLMQANTDTLISVPGLDNLLRLLRGEQPIDVDLDKTYFLCRRYQVPWQFTRTEPSPEEWERHLLLQAAQYRIEGVFSVSAEAGALLASRSIWREMQGLDERLDWSGSNDIDFGMRVGQSYPWVDLSCVGVACYHMEHPPGEGRRAVISVRENHINHNPLQQVNSSSWGLGDVELSVQRSSRQPAAHSATHANSATQSDELGNLHARLSSELNNPKVGDCVKRVIQFYRSIRWDSQIPRDDLDMFILLAWYSSTHFPRRFLEFGVTKGFASLAVGTLCPSVEVYGIDRWQNINPRYDPVYMLQPVIHRAMAHRGYMRFVNGDPETGLARLHRSMLRPRSFDLILVREQAGCDAGKILDQSLEQLGPGGALVLRGMTCDSLDRLWNGAAKKHDCVLVPLAGSNTGLILKWKGASAVRKPERIPPIAIKQTSVRLMMSTVGRRIWQTSHLAKRALRLLLSPGRLTNQVTSTIRSLCQAAPAPRGQQ